MAPLSGIFSPMKRTGKRLRSFLMALHQECPESMLSPRIGTSKDNGSHLRFVFSFRRSEKSSSRRALELLFFRSGERGNSFHYSSRMAFTRIIVSPKSTCSGQSLNSMIIAKQRLYTERPLSDLSRCVLIPVTKPTLKNYQL